MINRLQKGIVDVVYGVSRVKTAYEREHPAEKVVAADGCKAITTNGDQDIERGLEWVASKRAVVMLTDKRIICDTWDIPFENIETAQLLKIGSLFGQGQVIKIKTKDNKHYQFGMQFNREWVDQPVLPMTIEQGKIKTSLFSLFVRIIAIGYLLYWVLKKVELL